MSEEWSSEHVLRLGTVIMISVFILIILVNLCHGVHRMKTHSKLATIYMRELKDLAGKTKLTKEETDYARQMSKYLKQDNYAELANMLYDPLVNSRLGKTVDYAMFHTTMGRTTMQAQVELNVFFRMALGYFFGQQLSSFVNYVIDISDYKSQSRVTALVISATFCVLFIVGISQVNMYIETRMHHSSIIDSDQVEEELKKIEVKVVSSQAAPV